MRVSPTATTSSDRRGRKRGERKEHRRSRTAGSTTGHSRYYPTCGRPSHSPRNVVVQGTRCARTVCASPSPPALPTLPPRNENLKMPPQRNPNRYSPVRSRGTVSSSAGQSAIGASLARSACAHGMTARHLRSCRRNNSPRLAAHRFTVWRCAAPRTAADVRVTPTRHTLTSTGVQQRRQRRRRRRRGGR